MFGNGGAALDQRQLSKAYDPEPGAVQGIAPKASLPGLEGMVRLNKTAEALAVTVAQFEDRLQRVARSSAPQPASDTVGGASTQYVGSSDLAVGIAQTNALLTSTIERLQDLMSRLEF
jgi:hypothetical protein